MGEDASTCRETIALGVRWFFENSAVAAETIEVNLNTYATTLRRPMPPDDPKQKAAADPRWITVCVKCSRMKRGDVWTDEKADPTSGGASTGFCNACYDLLRSKPEEKVAGRFAIGAMLFGVKKLISSARRNSS